MLHPETSSKDSMAVRKERKPNERLSIQRFKDAMMDALDNDYQFIQYAKDILKGEGGLPSVVYNRFSFTGLASERTYDADRLNYLAADEIIYETLARMVLPPAIQGMTKVWFREFEAKREKRKNDAMARAKAGASSDTEASGADTAGDTTGVDTDTDSILDPISEEKKKP